MQRVNSAVALGHRKQIMALLAVGGGLGVAGAGLLAANSYRKVMASFDSKGVEHILNEEDRAKLRAENESKIKECAGTFVCMCGGSGCLHAGSCGGETTRFSISRAFRPEVEDDTPGRLCPHLTGFPLSYKLLF